MIVSPPETALSSVTVKESASPSAALASATVTAGASGSATVTISNASALEGKAMTFTATLNRAVQGGLIVTPGFTDVTAAKGVDYTENTAALSFAGTAG